MSAATRNKRELFSSQVRDSFSNGTNLFQRPGVSPYPMRSFKSGREYAGINALYLQTAMVERGYYCADWITFSDAQKEGMSIKKGEKGVLLEHWELDSDGAPHCKGYNVFNLQQLANLNKKAKDRIEIYKSPPSLDAIRVKGDQFLEATGVDSPDIAQTSTGNISSYQDAVAAALKKDFADNGIADVGPNSKAMSRYLIAEASLFRSLELPPNDHKKYDMEELQGCSKLLADNPLALFSAVRDSNMIVSKLAERTQLQIAEANRAEQIMGPVKNMARGNDANLRAINLNGSDETLVASIDDAKHQIAELHTSAGNSYKAAVLDAQTGDPHVNIVPPVDGVKYTGKIIALEGNLPDKWAIQKIIDNRAVIHRVSDISQEEALMSNEELVIASNAGAIASISEAKDIVRDNRIAEQEEMYNAEACER